jgi:hypothetical protein
MVHFAAGFYPRANDRMAEPPTVGKGSRHAPIPLHRRIGRAAGYAGPANRAAAEVVTKYIITDMYAKAVQGMPAEDAVKWAHGELVKIYS